MERFDTVIIGAGAAGMFCAAQAGQAGSRVLLIDNGKSRGVRFSCLAGTLQLYQSLCRACRLFEPKPHFCKSALARYTQWDFIDPVGKHGIALGTKNARPAVLR